MHSYSLKLMKTICLLLLPFINKIFRSVKQAQGKLLIRSYDVQEDALWPIVMTRFWLR